MDDSLLCKMEMFIKKVVLLHFNFSWCVFYFWWWSWICWKSAKKDEAYQSHETLGPTIALVLFFHPLSSLSLFLPSLSFSPSSISSPPPLFSQSVCRAAPVILSLVTRTPPCGGNSSSSSAGSASMRTAAVACQSNCMINGGCGCRNRTKRATR